MVLGVIVPAPPAGQKSGYRKVRARGSWDFAMGGLAHAVTMKAGKVAGARFVLSGVAPTPWRLPAWRSSPAAGSPGLPKWSIFSIDSLPRSSSS